MVDVGDWRATRGDVGTPEVVEVGVESDDNDDVGETVLVGADAVEEAVVGWDVEALWDKEVVSELAIELEAWLACDERV